jgi:hypothetical protein
MMPPISLDQLSDIADHLQAMGVPVKSNSVTLWLKELPSAQDFGRIGVAASRADVTKMLAARFVSRQSVNEYPSCRGG